jgi:hypothetical protein
VFDSLQTYRQHADVLRDQVLNANLRMIITFASLLTLLGTLNQGIVRQSGIEHFARSLNARDPEGLGIELAEHTGLIPVDAFGGQLPL